MSNIVGVTFKENSHIYFIDAGNFRLHNNLTIVVNCDNKIKFAKIVKLHVSNTTQTIGKIVRIATKKDYFQYRKNLKDEKEALLNCRELVKEKKMNMHIIDASYTLDREQLVFRFIADTRIDFRDLAKKLASIYKTRIELRQIGIRDKAKEVGGCGPCGQKLCCARFLKEFDGVTINMAKTQNLALNPSKINGVCGRLFCCLKYENECYKECKKGLPKIGDKVTTPKGEGIVTNIDILNMKYNVDIPNVGNIEISGQNES